MPDGKAYYQAMIEKFTTLDLTPKQIHQIGLKEVARIQAEMQATMQQAGFKGTMPEFLQFLRTDPQFYAKTPRELLVARDYVSRRWTASSGRRSASCRAIATAIMPGAGCARADLHRRSRRARGLHVQHLQLAGARRSTRCRRSRCTSARRVTASRRRWRWKGRAAAVPQGTYFSGYGEGWGLYTEWLGTDRHLRDAVRGLRPADLRDLARGRLVVDTGIHSGRLEPRAGARLHARHTRRSPSTRSRPRSIATSPGPGRRSRTSSARCRSSGIAREAEQALGAKFDQRQFHDAILRSAQCRCRCWRSAWHSSLPTAARIRQPRDS